MIENVLHDVSADVLALIGGVDNHVPDRGAVDEVGEDAAQTDETGSIPREIATSVWISISRASSALRDLAHGACLKRENKLGRLDVFAVGVGDHGLESSALLVLGYCLRTS